MVSFTRGSLFLTKVNLILGSGLIQEKQPVKTLLDRFSLKLTSEDEIHPSHFFSRLDDPCRNLAPQKGRPSLFLCADCQTTSPKMPKDRTSRSSTAPHVHTGCALCTDFAGMCDLHTDCKECIKQGLDKVFTLDHWKGQCKKALDVADYERSKGKDWQNMATRQAVLLVEKSKRITSLESVQLSLERQLRKANLQIEKSKDAYSRMCAESSKWKQQVKDLKVERAAIHKGVQGLCKDARLAHNLSLQNMQAVLDRSITIDPSHNLMNLFNAVANEYEASVEQDGVEL